VFVPFAPADKIPLDLQCPTVPMIAWECSNFPGLPSGSETPSIWRLVLEKLDRALALSRYSARVVAEAMGPDFRISAVPPPVPTRSNAGLPMESTSGGLDIETGETVLDTAVMHLHVDLLGPAVRLGARANEATEQSTPMPGSQRRPSKASPGSRTRVNPGEVVYTAVFNPNKGSKNFRDLVTAFCWAFRETEDATLLLKIRNRGLQAFYTRLIPILYQLSPFKCRVVVIPDYLPDSEYEKLIRATTYYVNSSTSERVCLPLMEFMSRGKPAIAPAHSAMSDFIDKDVAFVLRSSAQLASWPDDQYGMFRTMSFRLDWQSLRDAYRESYHLAKTEPGDYRTMSNRAREEMQRYASPEVVTEQLRNFFFSAAEDFAARR
jgi:glycosyltransferase involved in cell wall biosynthesis